jgi:hypothetical protein
MSLAYPVPLTPSLIPHPSPLLLGSIMLPEFMYGMVSWVGFADDVDEEEEAEAV